MKTATNIWTYGNWCIVSPADKLPMSQLCFKSLGECIKYANRNFKEWVIRSIN